MPTRSLARLHGIFATLLAPLVVTSACKESIDESQFSEDLCNEGYQLHFLDAVEPAMPADYLELRDAQIYGAVDPVTPRVIDSSGSRCSGATDRPACEAAFTALPLESSFHDSSIDLPSDRSLAYTRGDTVGAVGELQPLLDFLGEIDAPGDAALLATLRDHRLVCGPGNDVGEVSDGYVLFTTSGGGCGPGDDIQHHVVHVDADGTIEVIETELIEKADPGCVAGRLPAGVRTLRRVVPRAASSVGAFLADVAQLEAAAVTAFGELAQELRLHRAPAAMVRAAWRSRREEILHAQVMARLARRHGGYPIAPRSAAWAPRGLAEVAADNAAEGCVRETYGALVAQLQARQAQEPGMRRVLRRIARDETRHAALSWSLAQWAQDRMGARDRRRVAARAQEALARLEPELLAPHAPAVQAQLGMPSPEQAHALYHGLRGVLFGRAAVVRA